MKIFRNKNKVYPIVKTEETSNKSVRDEVNNNFIKINYPEENIMENINSVVISCSDFFEDNIENELTVNNEKFDFINYENNLFNLDDDEDDEDIYLDLTNNFNKEIDLNFEKITIDFYQREEDSEIKKSINYENENFCFYCKNYLVLPDYEIKNFLNFHLVQKKYSKYLILVFRLCPNIFSYINVMENKYLRKYIYNYLDIQDIVIDDKDIKFSNDINIYNHYQLKNNHQTKEYIYENLFHQPNLKYTDYVKCDSCKHYLCPMHTYLSKFYFNKCDSCNNKTWTICGWCKYSFNEGLACEYIHKKIEI